MPRKVEWNKEHTWKILKQYDKSGKLCAIKFDGEWYYPKKDYSGRDYMYGTPYIASDVCDNCALQHDCKAFNPINNACEERNE